MLDLSRRSYYKKFAEKYDELLDIIEIESKLDTIDSNVIKNRLERLDKDITYALSKARKYAEENMRRVLCLVEKVHRNC